jgi:uncharacterized protein YkwD
MRGYLAITLLLFSAALPLSGADDKQPAEKKVELSEDEKAVLDLTNEARTKAKLPPLKPNAVLFAVARAHSANMAKQEKMEHELDGETPADRVKSAKYAYAQLGENIAVGQNVSHSEIVKMWMESLHHKENILNEAFQEIGLGLAKNDKGEVYYTQVFAKPRPRE